MTKPKIMLLNGPNLNMLGTRQPEIYGQDTLADIEDRMKARAEGLDLTLDCRQSNHEGALVDWIQEARGTCAGIIINPGAYSHTSIAILDALLACEFPIIELHLSNIHQRESFRHRTYVSLAATAMICGLGPLGYETALDAMAGLLARQGAKS